MSFVIWVHHEALPAKPGKLGFDKVLSDDIDVTEITGRDDVLRALENWWPERLYPYHLNFYEYHETFRSYLVQPETKGFLVHHWNLTEQDVESILPPEMVGN